MICPRCWQTIPDGATTCPSCGRRATGAPAVEQPAQQGDAGPRVIPVLSETGASRPASSGAALTPDETPTLLAKAIPPDDVSDSVSPDGATAWASVPTLSASDDLDDIPFAMTAAPASNQPAAPAEHPAAEPEAAASAAPTVPTVPAEPASEPEQAPGAEPAPTPDGDGLPDYETPDIERPAIHAPKPPLPDYDTPDEERPAVHPVPADPFPAAAPLTPLILSSGPVAANGAHGTSDANVATDSYGDHDSSENHDFYDAPTIVGAIHDLSDATDATDVNDVNDVAPDYPAAYASPHAGYVDQAGRGAPPPSDRFSSSSEPRPSRLYQPAQPTASSDPIERFFGAQPPLRSRVANNPIQRLWLRFLPPESATAPWISIPVGALVALVAGLLVSIIGLLFWGRALGYLLDASTALGASENLVHAALAPNLLQLLLLEHGVPMALALGASGATGSFSALETLPLTGLSLIPAAALILGGYVAAASDFTHRLRFSVLRGALIGPVYAILLLLVALFSSSDTRLGDGAVVQLHPSVGVAFLAGLIWGALLGALGGLLAVRRHHLFTTNRRPDLLAGVSWGALIALGSGLLLALVALAAGVVAHAIGTVPAASSAQAGGGLGGALNGILVALSLLIVVAPVAALWLFTLGTGANIESWLSATGLNAHPGTSSLGLFAAQHHPPSVVWWLLLLIPLASYIIGGRAAAHIARADSVRDGALAGALMAVALSLVMLALTLLTRVVITSEATTGSRSITTTTGIAPASLAAFLLVLLVGGALGALGGASAALAPQAGAAISWRIAPLLPRMEPALSRARQPWDMFDVVRGRPTPRTPMRALFYATILAAVVLVALFIVVALLGWIASHFAPIGAVRGLDGFFAGLAVGVPLLLLACAAILATLRALPSLLRKPPAHGPVLPRYPTAR